MNTGYKKSVMSIILRLLVIIAACVTGGVLLFIVGYILVKGIPNLSPELFAWEYNSDNLSMLPSIINTLIITAISLVIAVPLGIFSAIYLVEYAKRGNNQNYSRNPLRNSFYSLWALRHAVFRYDASDGLFHSGRFAYYVHNDSASYNAHD